MTNPYWIALHGMTHSSIELQKPLHHDKAVIHEGVIHVIPNAKSSIFFFIMAEKYSILYIYTKYLSIHLLLDTSVIFVSQERCMTVM